MHPKTLRTILWVAVFAIAMAFLETAVVVYLRKIYYPEGFAFPLRMIDPDIGLTEFFREIATLIMLAGVGFCAGKTGKERFAFFIFAFALWDIFYYVFLYVLLGWPQTLLTPDLLFMVPVIWTGPVLAPLINSMMMAGLAFRILYLTGKHQKVRMGPLSWGLLIAGSLVVIVSYTEEYVRFMLQQYSLAEIPGVSSNPALLKYAGNFIPGHFNWWIFSGGVLIQLAGMGWIKPGEKNPGKERPAKGQ